MALRKGSLVVNSSQGGGSKDTWVLREPESGAQLLEEVRKELGSVGLRTGARTTAREQDGVSMRPPRNFYVPAFQREAGMLSRVADSLYWMGRYLERAEHTARLVNVELNLVAGPVAGTGSGTVAIFAGGAARAGAWQGRLIRRSL